jgi:hypothetical protein
MIYEKYPQLHALSADDKKTLASELLREAEKQAATPQRPQNPSSRLEPAWKQQARDAAAKQGGTR